MKYLFWLLAGVGLGFLVAHKVSQTEGGKAFFASVDSTARQLSDAVVTGYRERASELRGDR
jgi:hypothetical protein